MSARAAKVRRRAARRSGVKVKQIPPARARVMADVAASTQEGNVGILTRPSRAIRRQYLRGVAAHGGDVDRLHFVTADLPPGDVPRDVVADMRARMAEYGCRIIDVADFRTG